MSSAQDPPSVAKSADDDGDDILDGWLTLKCTCGKVDTLVENNKRMQYMVCHCRDCKKVTGSSKSDILIVTDGFITTTNQTTLFIFDSECGKGIVHLYRCGTCGAPIYYRQYPEKDNTEPKYVFAGGITDPEWIENRGLADIYDDDSVYYSAESVEDSEGSEEYVNADDKEAEN